MGRDAGLPSRREKAKGANMLAKTVQERMAQWTDDQFLNFEEAMNLIREGAPVQWVKLYMEAVKLGIVKESNINITVSRQQDRENLQALVRTRIPSALPSAFSPAVVPAAFPAGSVHAGSAGGNPAIVSAGFAGGNYAAPSSPDLTFTPFVEIQEPQKTTGQ